MIELGRTDDVLCGFCHNGSVAAVFMNSLLGAFAEDARRPVRRLVEYQDSIGPYIHDNRSRVARYFLEHTDKQWLWMLDNDMEFPPDALYRMLAVAEERNIRLLGAAYWNKYSGTETYMSWLLFTPDGIRAAQKLPDTDEPIPVTAIGMGCTLIHRDVLQDVADMHPNDPWDTFGADILVRFEDGGFMTARSPEDLDPDALAGREIAQIDRMGEDVTLCLRARRCGYEPYGLPTLTVGHYKAHHVRPAAQPSLAASGMGNNNTS